MPLSVEQRQLVSIRREERAEQAKRARSSEEVFAEIKARLDAEAAARGLTPEAYRNFLEEQMAHR